MPMLHIMFGESAAGTLKQVLSVRGSNDRVIALADDLSWGPIGQDVQARVDFFNVECPIPHGWDTLIGAHNKFWTAVSAADERCIWLGASCPRETAGYLAYLDRYRDYPGKVFRPQEFLSPHPKYGHVSAVGVLNPEEVANVLDHASPRSISDDERYFRRWSELVADDALLRVIEGGELRSADLSHYDDLLLNAVTSHWRPTSRVVAEAIGTAFERGISIGDDLLFSRVARLAQSAAIEVDGEVLGWTSEMRRTPSRVRAKSEQVTDRERVR